MNKVIIHGNLGSDPETRTTQGGTAIANFRVATRERVKKGEEWVDHTEWVTVVAFGRTAENVQKYLKKGSGVLVIGKMRTEEYTDKEGVKRWTTKVLADELEFTTRQESGGQERQPATKSKSGGGSAKHSAPVDDDSDLPF